jgi:hypothetical protein
MEGALLKEAVLPSLGQCNTVSHTYLPLYFNSWPHDISTLGPTDEKRDNNHTYKTTACLYFHSCLHESERTDSRAKDAKGTSASLSHWPTRASKCKSSTSLITTLLSLKSSIQSGRNTLGVSIRMFMARVECPMRYAWAASADCPDLLAHCCWFQSSVALIIFVVLVCWRDM